MTLSETISKAISDKIGQVRGSGLRAKSTRGSIALCIGAIAQRGIRLIRNMILARILAPDEFGLMAIIFAAIEAFEAFAVVGLKQSIIQNKRGGQAEYLNVAWFMQALRGFGLFAIAFLVAPWVSSFYGKPELLPLLRIAFVAILFRGFFSPRTYELEKKFRFGKLTFWNQGCSLLGTIVTIGLAVFLVRNVWALVIGFVAESGVRCLSSFIFCPFLPTFSIDKESLSDILKYARRMFGVAFLAAIALQLDVAVLGKVVSDKQLGMYSLAYLLAMQPCRLFSRIFCPVLLPLLSEKQDNKRTICHIIVKMSKYTLVFLVPITTVLIMCAKPVLSIVYGSKYIAVAMPFGLLCVYSSIQIESLILSQVYFAIGEPHLHRRFVALRLMILACLMYPSAVLYGLSGAAAVVLFANLIGLCMQVIWMQKSIGLRFSEYFLGWVSILGLAIIIVVPMVLLKLLKVEIVIVNITVGGVFCLLALGVGLLLVRRNAKPYCVSSQTIG